ncbi:hypothetical protein [Pseudonocardia sp. 73-21]|uniref:hypothetical protein n=1 Tax=Pseudonocardia sp. 73-21 TaxID=1895809 RepID=UPI00095A5191|nr:hypothetical protein [Pseudonocardia sp. 73-21]OJY45962.1 MAG: hypothetical protein BGP03_31355 [Pseudonocardia sp. 73-21]
MPQPLLHRVPSFTDPEIVAAVWAGIRPARDYSHRAAGADRCPAGARAALRMLGGARVPLACEPCYDLLVDVLLHIGASERLRSADNPGGYARRSAEHFVTDRLRAENASLYGVAKPDRRDGTVGAVRAALLDGGSPLEPSWASELLTLVLSAAAARAPLGALGWPYDAFAAAKGRHYGRADVLRREVIADVAAVLDAVDRIAGTQWRDAYIDAPMRARRARYSELRVGEPWPGSDRLIDPAAPATAPGQEGELRAAFWDGMADHGPVQAARLVSGTATATAATLRGAAVGWLLDLLALPGLPVTRPYDAVDVRAAVAHVCGPEAAGRLPAPFVATLVARSAALDAVLARSADRARAA